MNKVLLGSTGMAVSPLIFGSLPLGPLQADMPLEQAGRLLRHALDRGVNMIDTAELYETFGHIRAALKGYNGSCYLVSKTHATDPVTARQHVERALRELCVERLDIVHVHAARVADPFTERAAIIDLLLEMRHEGKIAHVGISTHYISAVRQAARHPEIAVVHPLINREGMGILDGSAQEMAEAIAEVATAGKGVYAMKALAGGNLIAQARQSLRFVRDLPGVHGVAVGMLSETEVDANIALFSDSPLDDGLWRGLEARRRRLKIMERFCVGCGACVEACTNHALSVFDGKARVDEDRCILCGYCAAVCPEFMIRVV
ncbi:aldo/keto reductase [Trichloromonas sp.]|uniref:aldo/keto reductase n=1 Tax=Trichloromonas sp. TaxID=3069249 RepID=UPI002A3B3D8A|nr:aldo/keto reductase [Trichloromonas sp.]